MADAGLPLTAWAYGICVAAYGLFALHLVRRGYWAEGIRARGLLAAISLSLPWAIIELLGDANGTGVAGAIADLIRYGGWYFFLFVLIRTRAQKPTAFLGKLGALLLATGVMLQLWRAASDGAAAFSPAVVGHAIAMVVFAIFLLEQLLRNVENDSRWNIKPLSLGLGAIFLFDLYFFSDAMLFGRFDSAIYSVRGLIHAAVIPLLGIATTRAGARLAKIQLSQQIVLHSTTLLLIGAYLVTMAAMGYYVRYFGGEWGRAIQYALAFGALLLLSIVVLSASVRARLRVFVSKHFFRYRFDYREEWLSFTRVLSAQDSLQGMEQQVIRGLADMVESPGGSLWLRDPAHHHLSQVSRWNTRETAATEPENGPFCQFLRSSGWVINLEEYRRFSSRYQDFEMPAWLSRTDDAWLVVPLFAAHDLIGFVLLARARAEIEVDWEVNDLLKTAGRQAAGFLAQLMSAEALIEARKFEAFNRMSAFVVHDLKNIVAQLSLLVRNAERHSGNPEFQQDMLMTVQNSVERMRQLMLQLRDGATPEGARQGVSLGEIAQRIGRTRQAQGRHVEVEVTEPAMTRGHAERIERVIGHAVQNALDATDASGRVWIQVGREGGRARVVVGDTGHGMSAEFIQERLFKPFQTTKESGIGIGAYESFQYVRELGGDVRVASEVDSGTTITMLLPLFQTEPDRLAETHDGR